MKVQNFNSRQNFNPVAIFDHLNTKCPYENQVSKNVPLYWGVKIETSDGFIHKDRKTDITLESVHFVTNEYKKMCMQ